MVPSSESPTSDRATPAAPRTRPARPAAPARPDRPAGSDRSERQPAWSVGRATGRWQPLPGACALCQPPHTGGGLERPLVTSPEAAAAVLVPALSAADREACVAALLDTKHRLLSLATVSVGSLDHTFMGPREVFRDALLGNAAAVVVAHNHPSGDPEPSRDDELVTRRLRQAGDLVGIELLDHLVVGGDRWISLARRGVC